MLLIGIKTNLITYPTNPITANPIAQEEAILKNSFLSGLEHFVKNLLEFSANSLAEEAISVNSYFAYSAI
jgi:hypothetical protein